MVFATEVCVSGRVLRNAWNSTCKKASSNTWKMVKVIILNVINVRSYWRADIVIVAYGCHNSHCCLQWQWCNVSDGCKIWLKRPIGSDSVTWILKKIIFVSLKWNLNNWPPWSCVIKQIYPWCNNFFINLGFLSVWPRLEILKFLY